jgi:ubiquinone/menaquinone biosynthesis C-methylase UbiE
MYLLFRSRAPVFLDFKKSAHAMTPKEFGAVYEELAGIDLQGETDLNKRCTEYILRSLKGKSVLEVGCGRGYLATRLAEKLPTTACDIFIPPKLQSRYPEVKFDTANIESLPYPSNSFDTVVTTHTLEHVQDLALAISELRRVARKRLIIVVPRQRPYNYNFSLHLNFFSHEWSFPALLGYRPHELKYLGDWLYIEDYQRHTSK